MSDSIENLTIEMVENNLLFSTQIIANYLGVDISAYIDDLKSAEYLKKQPTWYKNLSFQDQLIESNYVFIKDCIDPNIDDLETLINFSNEVKK